MDATKRSMEWLNEHKKSAEECVCVAVRKKTVSLHVSYTCPAVSVSQLHSQLCVTVQYLQVYMCVCVCVCVHSGNFYTCVWVWVYVCVTKD